MLKNQQFLVRNQLINSFCRSNSTKQFFRFNEINEFVFQIQKNQEFLGQNQRQNNFYFKFNKIKIFYFSSMKSKFLVKINKINMF